MATAFVVRCQAPLSRKLVLGGIYGPVDTVSDMGVGPKERTTALASLGEDIVGLLRVTRDSLRDDAERLEPGLSLAGYEILVTVIRRAPVSPSVLCDETGMHKSVVSRLLKTLTDAGLVTRERDLLDARSSLFSPSAAAAQRYRDIAARNLQRFAATFDGWSDEELSFFTSQMRRVLDTLRGS